MAGLACGLELHKAGVNFAILEASDGVGGRVRTDQVDGFLLDRGFQIFLTSYEEAQAMLDYTVLDLKPFYAGGTQALLFRSYQCTLCLCLCRCFVMHVAGMGPNQ
jgi:phytoene dehydrogenase-like protein